MLFVGFVSDNLKTRNTRPQGEPGLASIKTTHLLLKGETNTYC